MAWPSITVGVRGVLLGKRASKALVLLQRLSKHLAKRLMLTSRVISGIDLVFSMASFCLLMQDMSVVDSSKLRKKSCWDWITYTGFVGLSIQVRFFS